MRKDAEAFPRASVAAINRTARSAKTQANRTVRQTYNIKARDFNQVTRIRKATRNTLQAEIVTSERRISLRRYSARQMRKGVRVTIVKGKPRVLSGTFIVKSLGGQVFRRKTTARLPIEKMSGPSVMHMMASRNVFRKVSQFIDRKLPEEMDRAIKYFKR